MATPTWQPGTLYQPGAIVQRTTAPAPVATQPTNPGFESGDTGWTKGTDWTIIENFDEPFQGTWTARKSGPPGTSKIINNAVFPVSPGQAIQAQCQVQQGPSDVGQTSGCIILEWYDIADVLLSTSEGNRVIDGRNGGWKPSVVSAVAPPNAVNVRIGGTSTSTVTTLTQFDAFSWNYTFAAPIDGLVFRAVQPNPGYSDSAEPAWPSTLGQQVVDNEVTWEAINSSRIVWEANPILVSGASEPTFPLFVDQTVSDNTIIWTAVSRRVEDARCPNTVPAAIAASKIFAADDDVIGFSATVNPLDWSSNDDAGYIPFGLQTYGSNPVTALGLYRGNLVAFNSAAFQMWQVDQDPANMALLDAVPIGCTFAKSVQPVQNDLVFLSGVGVRNIGIAGASTNLQAGTFGEVIDPLVKAKIVADEYEPIGLYVPSFGQYWLFFGPEAFVLSITDTKQMSWTRYVFPEAITDWTLAGTTLVLRTSTGKVWEIDEEAVGDDEVILAPVVPGFDIPAEPGTFLVSPGATIAMRSQAGVGTPRIPDGYNAVAGEVVLSPPGVPVLALAGSDTYFGSGFSGRFSGEDINGAPITEDVTVALNSRFTVGVTEFAKFTGFTLLTTTDGSDAFYTAGFQQFTPDVGGSDLIVDIRGALTIRAPYSTGAISLSAGLFSNDPSGSLEYPVTLPAPSQITVTRALNASAKTFTVNGTEVISLPAGVSGQHVAGATLHASVTGVVAGLVGSVFVDFGIRFTVSASSTAIVGVVQWPHLDFGALGMQKQLIGVDVIATAPEGVSISIGYDQRDLAARTADFAVDGDTLPGYLIPIPVTAPSLDLRLTFASGQRWELQAANMYIQDLRLGT